MTCHIAICDDSRDAGYVSELLHQWGAAAGLRRDGGALSIGGELPVPL